MKMEYSRPLVEIVDFAALERIATDVRNDREARDSESFEGTNSGSVVIPGAGGATSPGVGNEGVGDW